MALNCPVHGSESFRLLRDVPGGERDTPGSPQHTKRFLEESFRVWKMRDAKIADDAVKARRVKRKIARITLSECDAGISAASQLQLLR
jgi:hypothetical protein